MTSGVRPDFATITVPGAGMGINMRFVEHEGDTLVSVPPARDRGHDSGLVGPGGPGWGAVAAGAAGDAGR